VALAHEARSFVFEVRDLWPRSIVKVGAMSATNPIVRGLEMLELILYQCADHIVVVTESFVDQISALGIDRSEMTVITNGVDLELFTPRPRDHARRALGLPSGFLATYVGTHGMAHGIGTILDAAKLPESQGTTFLLVGEGAEKATLKEPAARERRASRAGVFSPPEDAGRLVSTLSGLAADPGRADAMGRSSRANVETNYSRPVLAARNLETLQAVA
jgi:glycosyltransferase involved in cell wall biosynthesis